jgi:glucose uptake protein GlcU
MHVPLVVGKLLVLVVGVFITYLAYDGYRRHRSSAMLYFAIGFGLVSVGTVIEGLLFEVAGVDIILASTIQTVITALGMATVLYSLYGRQQTTIEE